MAKTKRRRSYKKKTTLPLGVVLPAGIMLAKSGAYALGSNSQPLVTAERFGDHILMSLTGYSAVAADFKPWRMKMGLLPIGIGFLAHKVAGKVGVNRALGRAGIPLVRI